MKLMVLLLRDSDAENAIQSLTRAGYRVTRIASTGGFLRSGMATLLVGLDDAQVEPVLQLLRQLFPRTTSEERHGLVFVLPVERFEQIS